MSKVSRFGLLVLTCVSGGASCEPYIQPAEPRPATAESVACADRKITHATGFIGLSEREVLTSMYRQIMSPSMEEAIADYVSSLPESRFPEDASREELLKQELSGLELLRSDFEDPRILFAAVEHVEGISPEEVSLMWMPGAWSDCLYKIDRETDSMIPYRPREDEGFSECVLWLSVSEDGSVSGELKVAIGVISSIHWHSWDLSWEAGRENQPPILRPGNHRWVAVMDFY